MASVDQNGKPDMLGKKKGWIVLRNFARTRLMMMIDRKLATKACVVALPTPAAPGRQEKPL